MKKSTVVYFLTIIVNNRVEFIRMNAYRNYDNFKNKFEFISINEKYIMKILQVNLGGNA